MFIEHPNWAKNKDMPCRKPRAVKQLDFGDKMTIVAAGSGTANTV